ncbi:hypothetical protein PIB30_080392, partial [Stylosanthes scabra]|nr:hypothetical protein [Stylosanthes scabra]
NFILNLKRWEEDKPIVDATFIHVPIWFQFWNLPEHYKTKELGLKLGASFGEVIDTDLFQEEKWGEWLRSEQGGRRSIMKENANPNLSHDGDSNPSKHSNPTPVNLIKSLDNLSMNSRNENQPREEEEVISKSTPILPNIAIPDPNVPNLIQNTTLLFSQSEFVFATLKENPQIASPQLSLKQQARKKYKRIVGIKRK